MKFKTTYQIFKDNPLWQGHIIIPLNIAEHFKSKGIKRLICNFRNEEKTHSTILSNGDGSYFMHLNKELMKKLDLKVGTEIEVELTEDTSKYGMHLPEEMEELLLQDPEGEHYFHLLTPGKQRSLLYIIGKPKGSDTRLKKAITVINYLKSTKGKLDFKELNQAFKIPPL